MLKIGIRHRLTKWLSSCFINRTAIVRVNGSIGPIQLSRMVFPSAPSLLLLFAINTNDLLAEYKDDTFLSAYADDLAIQLKVYTVDAWSAKERLTLNTSKCQTVLFSLDCADPWIVPGNPTSLLMDDECSAIHTDFHGCLVRSATHHWRECTIALPIDVWLHQPPQSSRRHDLGMAHIG